MTRKTSTAVAALALASALFSFGSARADTVLFDSSGLIQGTQSYTQSVDIKTPGTLTVTLSQIPWFDPLKDLTLLLSTADGLLNVNSTGGSDSIHLGGGEEIFANWFGTADGAFKIGAYGIKIEFRPDNVTPVPLPMSWVLLFSGLTLLLIWRRPNAAVRVS